MITRTRLIGAVATIALAGMMFGCGGGSGAATSASYVPQGKDVGGPVAGATVFADRVTVVNGVETSNFVKDTDEISAVTDANGNYVLPPVSYKHVLVSTDGVDTITGIKSILMARPGGVGNITPLTTLVALTAPAQAELLRSKLESMLKSGKYDDDVSVNSSSAVLLLIKSIETATRSLTDAITVGTLTQPPKYSYDDKQKALIQVRIMQAIAAGLVSRSVAEISTPSTLTAILDTALVSAINKICEDFRVSVVSDATFIATSVAVASVSVSNTSLGSPNSFSPLNSSDIKAESTLLGVTSTFFNAVVTTVSQIIGTTITSVLTPATFVPPQVPVFTYTITQIITGATGGTGGSGTGTQF